MAWARRTVSVTALLLPLMLLSNCSSQERLPTEQRVRSNCPSKAGGDYFFPMSETISPVAHTMSKYLDGFDEPSLSCGSRDYSESYRMLYAGSNRIRVVRIERGKITTLTYRERNWLSDAGSSLPLDRVLDETQWQSAKAAIQASGFWTDPGGVANLPVDALILFEGRHDKRYRVLSQVGAGPNSNNIPNLANSFLELADVPR